MREIKFRGWNKRELEYLFHDKGNKLMIPCSAGVLWLNPSIKDNNYVIKKDNFIMEQFTGLQDKNGVDIYEGDYICLDGLKTHRWEICYRGSGFIASPLSGNSLIEYRTLQNNNYLQFEVIGNIHTTKS